MLSDIETFTSSVASRVDEYIFLKVKGSPLDLYEASLHLVRAGGKRLRPALLIASGTLFGCEKELLVPFAAAVELSHTFTLIHDDIMDRDEFRRSVRTVHAVWGEPLAITAGDLLFAKAFELITDGEVRVRVGEAKVAASAYELARALVTVAEGQALDLGFEKRVYVRLDEYLEMVYKKTGALMEASARIGAIVAGAQPEDVDLMGEFARNMGVAFQIRDDYLGVYGREDVTGKPVFSDFRRGKKTVFVALVYELGDEGLKGMLTRLLGRADASREDYERLARELEAQGIKDEALRMLEGYLGRALSALEMVRGKVDRRSEELLVKLAKFAVVREK